MIQFAPAIAGQTIVLTSDRLFINKPLTIEGPIPQAITVSGGLKHAVFSVGGDVTIRNLSIVNGRGDYGGMFASDRLTLENSLVANNEGTISAGGIEFQGTTSA